MARIPPILERESLPEDARHAFDYLVETRGGVRVPFASALNSPELCQRIAHVGTYIRFQSSLPADIREIAAMTASLERRCAHEWAIHSAGAAQAGISDAAVEAIRDRGPLDKLSDEEAFAVRFARETVVDNKPSDASVAEARERLGDQGAIDLCATIGYYSLLACVFNTIDEPIDPSAPQLPPVMHDA